MYIAKNTRQGITEFTIRESYLDNGVYRYRDLMVLGNDPSAYIIYPRGRSFYIDERITDQLGETLKTVDYEELETIFEPYIHPDIRRHYDFTRSKNKENRPQKETPVVHHTFDKRRLIYLKTGNMNQKMIDAIKDKYFTSLNEKSRDEIEQHFILMESELPFREFKNYIYVIFDLQRHFKAVFAREMPEAIDPAQIAEHFVDDICKVNTDKTIWQGMKPESFLNDYLKRYVIMFFDNEYQNSTFLNDREFEKFNHKRYHRQHTRPIDKVYSEAAGIFGMPENELKKMNKRELKKLFRKKAQEFHPDKGGDHDTFVSLSRVFDELMQKK